MIAATCRSIFAAAISRMRSTARRSSSARLSARAPVAKERLALNGLRPSDGESARAVVSAVCVSTPALEFKPTACRCRRLLLAACSTTIVSSSSSSRSAAGGAGGAAPERNGASLNELARSSPSLNSSGSCDAPRCVVAGPFARRTAVRAAFPGAFPGAGRSGGDVRTAGVARGGGAIARAQTVKGGIVKELPPTGLLPSSRPAMTIPGSIGSVVPNAWPRCALGAEGAVASTEYLVRWSPKKKRKACGRRRRGGL